MILTCPACDTKYVVKDRAIPPQGRQVRCASCKHSWHQDPEAVEDAAAVGANSSEGTPEAGGPPEPPPFLSEQPAGEMPASAAIDAGVAGEPQPGGDMIARAGQTAWGTVAEDSRGAGLASEEPAPPVAAPEPPASDQWPGSPSDPEPAVPAEEEFVGYAPIVDEEQPRRRWPVILAIIILIAAAAAAFWFFAPAEWKERAGVAQASTTPLQLMITTSDRQPLQSGNELVAISGRVINPTDREQPVPPILAELRDKESRKLVHRWTIQPPARVLAPRSSASFNSAEMDVPKGGDELTVTLGGASG